MLSRRANQLKPGDMFEVMCFDLDHEYCLALVLAITPAEGDWSWVTMLAHQRLTTSLYDNEVSVRVVDTA